MSVNDLNNGVLTKVKDVKINLKVETYPESESDDDYSRI